MKDIIRSRSTRVVLALLAAILTGTANAQSAAWNVNPGLTDRWTLQLGAFRPNLETTAHLNSATGRIGTTVDFEDTLGFSDTKTVPQFLGSVRLGERWKIEGEYFQLNRSSSRTLNRTINWGDRTFTLGTTVNSEFDSKVYRLSAGYSFIKDNTKELGVVLGFHVTDFDTSIGTPGIAAQGGSGLAPLPTIGAYGSYALSPRWLLSARADYFSLNYNDYDGRLLNFNAGVDYRITRHFGLGVGYRYVDYEVTATKPNFNGGLEYRFKGPVLYMVASF